MKDFRPRNHLNRHPSESFVAVQIGGPYNIGHHQLRFLPEDMGARMIDRVNYRLPLGMMGRMAHSLRLRRDLEIIFNSRAQRIAGLFRR